MEAGVVNHFDASRGVGVITIEGSGQEIAVHVTGLVDDIRDGDQVNFEVTEGRNGLTAVNVKLA